MMQKWAQVAYGGDIISSIIATGARTYKKNDSVSVAEEDSAVLSNYPVSCQYIIIYNNIYII